MARGSNSRDGRVARSEIGSAGTPDKRGNVNLGRLSTVSDNIPQDLKNFLDFDGNGEGPMYDLLATAAERGQEEFADYLNENFRDDDDTEGEYRDIQVSVGFKASDGSIYRLSNDIEYRFEDGKVRYLDPSESFEPEKIRITKLAPVPGRDVDSDGEIVNRAKSVKIKEDAIASLNREIKESIKKYGDNEYAQRSRAATQGVINKYLRDLEDYKKRYPETTTPEVVKAYRQYVSDEVKAGRRVRGA
jgi:hypothetical protein